MKKILVLSLSIAVVYIVSSEIGIAFARASTVLAPEPLADSPAPDEIPPADSAEPPALDNNPSAVSLESTDPYSTPLEYFDVTRYGAVADGRTDGSSALKFVNVSYGTVRDVSLLKSKAVHVSIPNCESVDFSGFNIQAPGTSPNTDGIAVGHSNNITITSSTIGVGDDCVSIGPGSTNISVSSVHCGPVWEALARGQINEKDVVGVHVSNCTIKGTKNGVRVKTWPRAPPSCASNLVFENINMINVSKPIIIDQTYCPSGICKINQPSQVKLEDVSFKSISGTYHTMFAVTLQCSCAAPSDC
ncbi:Exopolygalacturonase protein [Spatholobus suberectus]|nr:Exopolygalacturonase protein [Spatholobus suberectus]